MPDSLCLRAGGGVSTSLTIRLRGSSPLPPNPEAPSTWLLLCFQGFKWRDRRKTNNTNQKVYYRCWPLPRGDSYSRRGGSWGVDEVRDPPDALLEDAEVAAVNAEPVVNVVIN